MQVRDENLIPHPRTEVAIKKEITLYYGMLSEMDKQVGRIITVLDKAGLRENTLIIFAGDNGLAVGQNRLVGNKVCMSIVYECR